MIGLDAVWQAIATLQDRLLSGPTLDRGTVLSNGSIQLDSDTGPLPTLPWVLGNQLTPGQRVLSIAWKGYRAVIGSASAAAIPSGSVQAWAGTSAVPSGWLLADGRILNISDYPRLAAALGATYGGNGTTTFGIPDLRGRAVYGVNSGTFSTLGQVGGEEMHTLTLNEIPSHEHNNGIASIMPGEVAGWFGGFNMTTGWDSIANNGDDSYGAGTFYSGYQGGGAAHNNLPPYIALNYLIKT